MAAAATGVEVTLIPVVMPLRPGGYVASGETWERGWMLAKNSAGVIVEATAATGLVPYGFAWQRIETAPSDSTSVKTNVELGQNEMGVWSVPMASGNTFSESDPPAPIYMVNNQEFGKSGAAGLSIGGLFLCLDQMRSGRAIAIIGPIGQAIAIGMLGGSAAANGSGPPQVNIPLASFVDPDGDPLAKFADGASAVPGFNLADSEAFGIRWNNHATPNEILTSVAMPQDLDDAYPVVVHILASKTGATLADAVTFTITAFFQTVGALHDADTNAGGVSSAMTGDAAAKTSQEVTRTIAAADVPASPSVLTLTVKPTAGTLGTDDVIVSAIWLEYTRKAA